jgi:RHS repeat-associated protein
MSTSTGTLDSSITFFPFGSTRTGSVNTAKKFTGQRLDDTGLYYYGARYYDATIGRFISTDTIVQNPANPQTLNRYSYCLNNPLKYIDPTGHDQIITTGGVNDDGETWYTICDGQGNLRAIATGMPIKLTTVKQLPEM